MAIDWSIPILVVDDHRSMQAVVTHQLRHLGFRNIDTAGDAVTALTMLAQRRYRLILSDWNMEPVSGIELLGNLRRDPVYATIPFILVTAESRAGNVLEARRLGVDGYLVKPFDRSQLKAKLSAILGAF